MIAVEQKAKNMRRLAIEMAYKAGNNGAHLGGGLSIIEIMAAIYSNYNPNDRVILSKGHGTLGYYTALAEFGFISKEKLMTFEDDGGDLPGQPSMNQNLNIDFSSGSLGLGLSLGVGCALGKKLKNQESKIYVVMGDGEMNEGSVWESVISAAHFNLNNLIVFVDCNGLQSDGSTNSVMKMNLENIWKGFGWCVKIVNGHNIEELQQAIQSPSNLPIVILAQTIKGKGISFMENRPEWHHGILTKIKYEQAIKDLS